MTKKEHESEQDFSLNFKIDLLVFVVMAIVTGVCFLLTLAGSQGGWLPVKATGYLFLFVFLLFLLTLFALAQLACPQWVRFDWRGFWLDQVKLGRGRGDER